MSDLCSSCSGKSTRTQPIIKCVDCKGLWHSKCAGIVSETLPSNWTCKSCEQPTLKDIMNKLKSMAEQSVVMTVSIDSCHTSIDGINTLLLEQDKKITDCLSRIDDLSASNESLKKANEELKYKLNDLEQYGRRNTVEIHGVPEPRDENILTTIMHVGLALNFKLSKQMIDACHRLRQKPGTANEPRRIILKFISRYDKDELLKARSVKRNFSTRDLSSLPGIGDMPDKPIYIFESLTQLNKMIFAKCREFQKVNNIKYLWVRNGKILMRKTNNSAVFAVRAVNDLADVH